MPLDTLRTCSVDQMPKAESDGYVDPTPSQRADWRIGVSQMLQGSCDFAVPVSLNGIVQVRTFTDTGNGRSYCQSRLRESAQGDKWSFCLTAGKTSPRIRREHEQETAPEPCIGL